MNVASSVILNRHKEQNKWFRKLYASIHVRGPRTWFCAKLFHARNGWATYVRTPIQGRGGGEGDRDAGYIWLQTALVQRIFRREVQVESWRLLGLNPSESRSLLPRGGRRQKLLLYSRNKPATRTRSILPVPSYPGSVSSVKGRSSLCTCSTTECVALLWRLAHAVETWCLRLQLRPEMRATFAQIMDSWILSSVMKFQV